MARKTLEQRHRGFHTGATAVPSTSTPQTCPLCDDTPEGIKGKNGHLVLQTHLMEHHRPVAPCPREHRGDGAPEWKLEWDAVLHGVPRLWYCGECGFYLKAD